MNFYSSFVDKLHFTMKPLSDLILIGLLFLGNIELETPFHQIKTSITETSHTFFRTVEFSLNRIGFVLFEIKINRKLDGISKKILVVV